MNKSLASIREDGLRVLVKELGPVGTADFLRQFENGSGNYTEEREELLKDVTIDDIVSSIQNRNSVKRF